MPNYKYSIPELIAQIQDLTYEIANIIEKTNNEYNFSLLKALEAAKCKGIDKFYEDLEPSAYHRTDDLYNAVQINETEDLIEVEFGYDHMSEHAGQLVGHQSKSAEYIYEYMFKQGYHGGEIEEINGYHPNPGTPYWYYVIGSNGQYNFVSADVDKSKFIVWMGEAPRSDPPIELVDYFMEEFSRETFEKYQQLLNSRVKKPLEKLKSLKKQLDNRKRQEQKILGKIRRR